MLVGGCRYLITEVMQQLRDAIRHAMFGLCDNIYHFRAHARIGRRSVELSWLRDTVLCPRLSSQPAKQTFGISARWAVKYTTQWHTIRVIL